MSTIKAQTGSTFTYLQSYLNSHTTAYQNSMEQLSSGNKYNSVSQNPVDVCHADELAVTVETTGTANDNTKLGGDMLTMAESSQENIISNLQRIRDLCVQAANGTYSSDDKTAILGEIQSRLNYIDSAASSTDFNNINILDGSASTTNLQIGTSSSDKMSVGDALIDVHTSALGISLGSSVNSTNWTSDDIAKYMNSIDTATNTLIASSSKLGAYLNRLDTTSDNLTNISNNLTNKKSVIADADTAQVSAELVQNQILQEASVNILVQVNNMQSLALSLFGQ